MSNVGDKNKKMANEDTLQCVVTRVSQDMGMADMPAVVPELVEQRYIQNRIQSIRGLYVIMDRDLAMLYGVKTIALNQAVKRNIDRFPERFRFQLTECEKNELITNCDRFRSLKHSTTLPYAFTEQGVTQLSAVLHSDVAVEMSIRICDAFVAMRHFLVQNAGVLQRLDSVERHQLETDNKIEAILTKMDELAPSANEERIFPTGCVFDAWEHVARLVRSAERRVVLIDNYCDERTLGMLAKRKEGVECIVFTRYTEAFERDLEKHNRQYEAIQKKQLTQKEHDRFLMIDDDVYIMGDSLKDLGHSLTTVLKTMFRPEEILEKLK